MLQITGTGKLIFNPEHLPHMHEQFRQEQLLKLPGFIETSILKRIMSHIEAAQFSTGSSAHAKTARELSREITADMNNTAFQLLIMLLNNSDLFRIIEQITDSQKIRSFIGRISRMLPNSDHHISWHDDSGNSHRLVGISINLNAEPYSGAVFQMREEATQRIFAEVANPIPGDAVIFRISREIQHRLTPLEGTVARTCGAGWFYSQPDFLTVLKSPYQ